MKITREGDDFSEDHEVIVRFDRSAYGIEVWMDDDDALTRGDLTAAEKERAIDRVVNEDWE